MMTEEIIVDRGFGDFRDFAPIPLDRPDPNARTRRIIRAKGVVNKKEASEPLQVTIVHQRRASSKDEWEDSEPLKLTSVRAGEEVRLELSCHQTSELFKGLHSLYQTLGGGLPSAGTAFRAVDAANEMVISGESKRILEALKEKEGNNLWELLHQLEPGLLEAVALRKQHEERTAAVEEFRARLDDPEWHEDDWQAFFERNEWIFGHGLDYRYLRKVEAQPRYGGIGLDGKGVPHGDMLTATDGFLGFTVLVEIKTPRTPLVGAKYRNRAYKPGEELAAGVAQIQAQCDTWAVEGTGERGNRERLLRQDIYTHQPRGILVIGNLTQVADDPDKRSTFELFRRNLHNPAVLTFDELLARAEVMVAKPSATVQSAPETPQPPDTDFDDLDDISDPFAD